MFFKLLFVVSFSNLCINTHIYIYNIIMYNIKQFKKHINPIEYPQCPEFSTTPAVFFSDMTSTDVSCIHIANIYIFAICIPLHNLYIYIFKSDTF